MRMVRELFGRFLMLFVLLMFCSSVHSPEVTKAEADVIPPGPTPYNNPGLGGEAAYTRELYERDAGHPPDDHIKRIQEDLQIREGMTVTDYGCGGGAYVQWALLPAVGPTGKVFAQEINIQAVELLHETFDKSPQVQIVHGDPWHSHLPEGQGDAVLMNQLHFFVHDPDGPWTRSALKTVLQHLKPGGRCAVYDHASLQKGWEPEQLARPFEAVGFQIDLADTLGQPGQHGATHRLILRRP